MLAAVIMLLYFQKCANSKADRTTAKLHFFEAYATRSNTVAEFCPVSLLSKLAIVFST